VVVVSYMDGKLSEAITMLGRWVLRRLVAMSNSRKIPRVATEHSCVNEKMESRVCDWCDALIVVMERWRWREGMQETIENRGFMGYFTAHPSCLL